MARPVGTTGTAPVAPKPAPAPVYVPHGPSGPVGGSPPRTISRASVGAAARPAPKPKPKPKPTPPVSSSLKNLLSTVKPMKIDAAHLSSALVGPHLTLSLPKIGKGALAHLVIPVPTGESLFPAPPKSSGGGLLGSIEAPFTSVINPVAGALSDALPAAGHVVVNLGSDVAHLPGDTLKAIGALAPSVANDFLQGITGHRTPDQVISGQSNTGHLLSQAISQDPIVQGIEGHGWKGAEQHPLQVLLDLSGAGGLADKTAGLLARSGALGSKAADVAKLETVSREAAPGIAGTREIKRLSSAPVAKLIQKATTKTDLSEPGLASHLPPGLRSYVGTRELKLRNQVAREHGISKMMTSQEGLDAAKALKKAAKPLGKTERGAVQYLTAFGGGRDTLAQALRNLEERRAGGDLSRATEATNAEHIANLKAALAKPDLNLPAMQHYADTYRALQTPLTDAKAALGVHEAPELERALLKQWALQRVPDQVVHIPKNASVVNPEFKAALVSAEREARDARAGITEAQVAHAKRLNATTDVQRELDQTQHRLTAARAAVSRDRVRRLPVTPKAQAKVDALEQRVAELKQVRAAERVTLRARGEAEIQAAKASHDLAKQRLGELRATPAKARRMSGTMVRDENATPIFSGQYKGQQLRPATTNELQAMLDASGDHPAYIRMTSGKPRPMTERDLLAGPSKERAAESGRKEYTGEAAKSGSWVPGTKAMSRSVQRDVRSLGLARERRNILDRFAMRDANGEFFKSEDAAAKAADQYERAHGLAASLPIKTDKGWTFVPDAVKRELDHQVKLDYPGAGGRGLLRINRQFRNTVLAMSPKLPVMHTVENTTRAGLAHAGPADERLAAGVIKSLKASNPEAAARLEALTTPGSLAGSLGRLSQEDFGALTREHQLGIMKAAGNVAQAYDQFASGIIHGQRWLEKYAQRAALGQHMRRTLQEFGHGMLDANTAIHKYADELAKAYSDPALAEDAAKAMHRAMGQYNNFPAAVRTVVTRVMPFAPWYFNAARLVFYGLPHDHPLLSAILQDVRHLTAPEWDKQHKGLPYDLQSAIKTGPSSYLDIGKFTPVGLNKQPLEELGTLAFPQFAGAGFALAGEDPFGQEFKGPNTKFGQRAIEPWSPAAWEQAASQLAGSLGGPAASLSRAIGGKGSTLYNTSTLWNPQPKPGTAYHGSGILPGFARVFNPFQGTHYGKKSKGSGRASYLGNKSGPHTARYLRSSGTHKAGYLK